MLLPMVCEVYLKFRDYLHDQVISGDEGEKKSRSALQAVQAHYFSV